ncbi:argininosuccinate lyase [uncultured Roseovarius sp.]|uniref:argininosuccinate lyase n=1 Tax=uncultured Roseovarius sp. TaxID=293344 RepID=UPI002603E808|nr:argininosuccinate lyase [uncultured Roseovarius sp.]
MMKRMAAGLLGLAVLAGCGVDGPPVRPSVNTTVSAGTGGVHARVGTGVRVGGVNIGVGVGL